MNTANETSERYDAVVIGGGPAGLSGALMLGRALRSVLVIDGGRPRNGAAAHAHAYLTRDGARPTELLDIGREEVARYGVRIVHGEVTAVDGSAGAFRVHLEDGSTVTASRLLVASGLVDELPAIDGLAPRWGRDVLHCPYCHGWEVRDQAIGVLATGPLAVHQALLWRNWSADVILFLHDRPEPTDEEYERLAARGVSVVTGAVSAVESVGERIGVRLEDGHLFERDALAVGTRMGARLGFLAGLGLQPSEMELNGQPIGSYLATDPTGATEVPGVWAAGNATDLPGQIGAAAAAGARAGGAINADLIEDEIRRAVEARAVEALDRSA